MRYYGYGWNWVGALIMMVFLTISLGISFFMNWYNARIALVEH
jgi:general L-amino acid transport system permease protein